MATRSAYDEARDLFGQLKARGAQVAQGVRGFVEKYPTPASFVARPIQQKLQSFGTQHPRATEFLTQRVEPQLQRFSSYLQEPYRAVTLPTAQVQAPPTVPYSATIPARVAAGTFNYLAKPIAEGIINAPSRIIGGTTKTGLHLGRMGRGDVVSPKTFASDLAQVAQGIMDINILPVGRKVALTAGKQALQTGFRQAVKTGAATGAKFAGSYGLLLGLQENKDIQDTARYLTNVFSQGVTGAATGAALGGTIAGGGHVAGKVIGTVYSFFKSRGLSDQVARLRTVSYVRDNFGRFAKEAGKKIRESPAELKKRLDSIVINDMYGNKTTLGEWYKTQGQAGFVDFGAEIGGKKKIAPPLQPLAQEARKFGVEGLNEKTRQPDGSNYVVEFVKSKTTGKITAYKYIINDKGEKFFVDGIPLEKAQEKYQSKDPEVIANRIVNPFVDYDFQREKYVAPPTQATGGVARVPQIPKITPIPPVAEAITVPKTAEFVEGDMVRAVTSDGKTIEGTFTVKKSPLIKIEGRKIDTKGETPGVISKDGKFYPAGDQPGMVKEILGKTAGIEGGARGVAGAIEKTKLAPKGIKQQVPAPTPADVSRIAVLPKSPIPSQEILEKATQIKLRQKVANGQVPPETPSLPDIIQRDAIDVKEKVNLFDYVRTPDRVLKKIGLEQEATFLRKKYNDYLDELPKQINRVTQWSKEVPSESNQRIFQFLDGKNIQLNSTELRVAGELRQYLRHWADRLKLPQESRITNYITHIFDKDFIKKEFDPEFAKIIENRVAGSVYDPFVEQRLGKMGYKEDVWVALDAYVKRGTRKANLDPALLRIKESAKNLELSQYKYVKRYIDRVNLRPTELDNLIDNTIKSVAGYKFGLRPTTSLTRSARQAVFRGTLGLNPATALKNLTQGANTYARLGEKYTLTGYAKVVKSFFSGDDELTKVGVLQDQFIQDRTINATKKFWETVDKGLFSFFDLAEKINRGAAYFGAKSKGLARGMNENQAIEYGLKTVRDTQFTFGSIDTPLVLSGDINKLLLQFQSYSIKQAEFLGEMAKAKDVAGLIRYSLAGMAMVGTIGKLFGMEPKDLIPSFRVGFPPTIQGPIEIGKAILGVPDKYGNIPDTKERLQNVGKSLIPFIPGGIQLKKTIGGLSDVSRGYSESSSGRIRYPVEQNLSQYTRGGLFGASQLPESKEYRGQDRAVLGEKQSAQFRQSTDKKAFYEGILQKRESNKRLDTIREATPEQLAKLTIANPTINEINALKKRATEFYIQGKKDDTLALVRQYNFTLTPKEVAATKKQLIREAADEYVADNKDKTVEMVRTYKFTLSKQDVLYAAKKRAIREYKAGNKDETLRLVRQYGFTLSPKDIK